MLDEPRNAEDHIGGCSVLLCGSVDLVSFENLVTATSSKKVVIRP